MAPLLAGLAALTGCGADSDVANQESNQTERTEPQRVTLPPAVACTWTAAEESDPAFAIDGLDCERPLALGHGIVVETVTVRVAHADGAFDEAVLLGDHTATAMGLLQASSYPAVLTLGYHVRFGGSDASLSVEGGYVGAWEMVLHGAPAEPLGASLPFHLAPVRYELDPQLRGELADGTTRIVELVVDQAFHWPAPAEPGIGGVESGQAQLRSQATLRRSEEAEQLEATTQWLMVPPDQPLEALVTVRVYRQQQWHESTVAVTEGTTAIPMPDASGEL